MRGKITNNKKISFKILKIIGLLLVCGLLERSFGLKTLGGLKMFLGDFLNISLPKSRFAGSGGSDISRSLAHTTIARYIQFLLQA